jgi:hypothetical protein
MNNKINVNPPSLIPACFSVINKTVFLGLEELLLLNFTSNEICDLKESSRLICSNRMFLLAVGNN